MKDDLLVKSEREGSDARCKMKRSVYVYSIHSERISGDVSGVTSHLSNNCISHMFKSLIRLR